MINKPKPSDFLVNFEKNKQLINVLCKIYFQEIFFWRNLLVGRPGSLAGFNSSDIMKYRVGGAHYCKNCFFVCKLNNKHL